MTTKTKKKKSIRDPITPIRFTPSDRRQLAKIRKAHPHLQTTADAVRFAIYKVEV